MFSYVTLTSSCRETDVKSMLFTYFIMPNWEENKYKRKHVASFQRSKDSGFCCMEIIACRGRHISFLLMDLRIICTNSLSQPRFSTSLSEPDKCNA